MKREGRGKTVVRGRELDEETSEPLRRDVVDNRLRGFAKLTTIKQIRDNFGSGWVDAGLTRKKDRKFSQNSATLVQIPLVHHVYFVCLHTLLKVVSHYDLSVRAMSMMGFPKKFR